MSNGNPFGNEPSEVNNSAVTPGSDTPAAQPEAESEDAEAIFRFMQLSDLDAIDQALPEPEKPGKDSVYSDAGTDFEEETPRRFLGGRGFYVLIAVCLVILLGAGSMVFRLLRQQSSSVPVILDNVSIAGIPVGGMTTNQAAKTIQNAARQYATDDMVVRLGEEVVILPASEVNVQLNVSALTNEAFNYGHTGSEADQQAARETPYDIDLRPYLVMDTSYIRDMLKKNAGPVLGTYRASGYSVEVEYPEQDSETAYVAMPCQTLVLDKGNPGTVQDSEMIYQRLVDAYCNFEFFVEIPEPEESSYREPDPIDLAAVYSAVCTQGKPAKLVKEWNTQTKKNDLKVTPGEYGYSFDLEAVQEQLDSAPYGEELRIPMGYSIPGIKNADDLFPDVLSSCVVPCDINATTNARMAAQTITFTVIPAGETFSFNKVMDKLKVETECADENPEDHGFCITASAVYQAALCADMYVSESRYHNYIPDFAEPGTDVTVGPEKQDLKIRNPYRTPVLLVASCTSTGVQVQMWGVETRAYTAKIQGSIVNTTKFQTRTDAYRPETGWEEGETVVEGRDGHTAQTYRMKYNRETGELMGQDYVRFSSYPVRAQVIVTLNQWAPVRDPKPTEPEEDEGEIEETSEESSEETEAPAETENS